MALPDRRLQTLRGAISGPTIEDAKRLLWLELADRGLDAEEIADWHADKCWFPWLREAPAILALEAELPAWAREGTRCEPQIIVHLPDAGTEENWGPHLDAEPPWAGERRYARIVGVALTESGPRNGGLVVWPHGPETPERERVRVVLEPGDAVVLHPNVWHAGGLNRTGEVRIVVYFRYLQEAP